MDWLRNWLLGVVGAGLLAGIAISLTPMGTVRRVVRLAGGLVVALAVLRPLLSVDVASLTRYAEIPETSRQAEASATPNVSVTVLRQIIQEETAAYIESKAQELGLACRATVTTRMAEDGATPIPYSVRIRVSGIADTETKGKLTAAIESDCAIPAERITWK